MPFFTSLSSPFRNARPASLHGTPPSPPPASATRASAASSSSFRFFDSRFSFNSRLRLSPAAPCLRRASSSRSLDRYMLYGRPQPIPPPKDSDFLRLLRLLIFGGSRTPVHRVPIGYATNANVPLTLKERKVPTVQEVIPLRFVCANVEQSGDPKEMRTHSHRGCARARLRTHTLPLNTLNSLRVTGSLRWPRGTYRWTSRLIRAATRLLILSTLDSWLLNIVRRRCVVGLTKIYDIRLRADCTDPVVHREQSLACPDQPRNQEDRGIRRDERLSRGFSFSFFFHASPAHQGRL